MSKEDSQRFLTRNQTKRLKAFHKLLIAKCFPLLPTDTIYFFALIALFDAIGLSPLVNYTFGTTLLVRGLSLSILSTFLFLVVSQIVRFAFTLLLYYNGWLFETVGKPPSLPTKLFMMIVSTATKRAKFFSCDEILPWLPLPDLKYTVEKTLETVRPIVSEEKMAQMEEEAQAFLKDAGPVIQRKLWLKWLTSKNYVSDWWKDLVYLSARGSLLKTNVGCADVLYQKTTSIQAARAAFITLAREHLSREIFQKESMKPIYMGPVPMCAKQYKDFNRTLRIPGEDSDSMIRFGDARHIAVFCNGCWYKINIYKGRRIVTAAELERSLQSVIDRNDQPCAGETRLNSLTMGPRPLWAKIRNNKFNYGVNKESLSIIESAIEVVFLDDAEHGYDEKDPSAYCKEYARALVGEHLWADKPSCYIFTKNGRFISNAEHSPCDAVLHVHIREYLKYSEEYGHAYGPDGHCNGEIEDVPKAERLQWNLDDETLSAIDESYEVAKGIRDDFDNANVVFDEFGKELMKKARVSPDAFLQMAFQLAYYRDQGRFDLTYEPAVMRLYKEGRTETVRSCSMQSNAFVRSMVDEKVDNSERLRLLRVACDRHQNYYREAMAGKGVDRHLFALYVVSRYYEIKSDFLNSIFSMNYVLSTSQTPQHQMSISKPMNSRRDLFWPAGGFCCPDGSKYGICYTIGSTGDIMSFHVTTWKHIEETSAERFLSLIVKSLREMRDVVENA